MAGCLPRGKARLDSRNPRALMARDGRLKYWLYKRGCSDLESKGICALCLPPHIPTHD